MVNTGLVEVETKWDLFTWSNKQSQGVTYSRIDILLANLNWMQQHMDYVVHIMEPSISDRALLCLKEKGQRNRVKTNFKFLNCVTEVAVFYQDVKENWRKHIEGDL